MHHAACHRVGQSRIRLVRYKGCGEVRSTPTLCMNCCDPPCEKACPTGATYLDAATQLVVVDSDLCIGCKGCVFACPFGACFIDPESDKAIRCDQCEGEPACVEMCPESALVYVRNAQINGRVKRRKGFMTPIDVVANDCR